jgi:hypothetical protein
MLGGLPSSHCTCCRCASYRHHLLGHRRLAQHGADNLIEGNDIELACNDGEQGCLTVTRTSTFRVSGIEIVIRNTIPGQDPSFHLLVADLLRGFVREPRVSEWLL